MPGLSHDSNAVDPTPHPSTTTHDATPPSNIDMTEVDTTMSAMLSGIPMQPPVTVADDDVI